MYNVNDINHSVFCDYVIFISREHLSEEDLRKNKAMLESLTKGQLVDNPEVIYNSIYSRI